MVFARLYMFLFLTHFRPTCSQIYTFAILYSTAKVAKVYSTQTKVGLQYIEAASFIGEGNRSTRRKPPTCHKLLTSFITYCCIEYTSPRSGSDSNGIRSNRHLVISAPSVWLFRHPVIIHMIELLCYNWRFVNLWLELWSHNWRFFIDVFDTCFYCLLMFSFCLFQYWTNCIPFQYILFTFLSY